MQTRASLNRRVAKFARDQTNFLYSDSLRLVRWRIFALGLAKDTSQPQSKLRTKCFHSTFHL